MSDATVVFIFIVCGLVAGLAPAIAINQWDSRIVQIAIAVSFAVFALGAFVCLRFT